MASSLTCVDRPFNDPDWGREEYIEERVNKILSGENVLITLGQICVPENLIPVLRNKYQGFFPGYKGALDEVVNNVKAAGKNVIIKELRGGNNSDALGLENGLDGHFVTLA